MTWLISRVLRLLLASVAEQAWPQILKARFSHDVGFVLQSDIVGHNISAVIHPDDLQIFKSHFQGRQLPTSGAAFATFQKNESKDESKSEPRHDKTNRMSVRPAMTQISLGIRLV